MKPKESLIYQTFSAVNTPNSQSRSLQVIKEPINCETKRKPIVTASNSYATPAIPRKTLSKSSIGITRSDKAPARCNGSVNIPPADEIVEDRYPDSEPENVVKNFFKKRLPMYNSLQYLEQDESEDQCSKTVQDEDSGRHTSSSGCSVKAQQFEQLKQEIFDIIADAPDGVWCTDLIKLYRDRYKRELNFSRFGYISIISVAYCLEPAVHISRPVDTGDWLLLERSRAAHAPAALRPRRDRTAHAHAHAAHPQECFDPDDALPGIEFDPDVFPEDCMHFMESIPALTLEEFRPGAMIEVIIGEVYSPSHFWFIRIGENYNYAMEDVMDEMTHYYNNEGRERVLARGALRVGHYCTSLYERDWHRSLIVKIIDSDTVKVRHVDYGTVDTLAVTSLKPLRRRWASLPAQAMRARLAGVRPCAAGGRWPHAACTAFLALVTNRRLVANVVATDARDAVTEMFLVDTASGEDVCISRELIRTGYADWRGDSSLRSLDVYLYPRFEALESGATPNYAELRAYLRDGIALDYVHAYRDHVPPLRPPSAERADTQQRQGTATPAPVTDVSVTTATDDSPTPATSVSPDRKSVV